MTKEETQKLLMIMSVRYPNWKVDVPMEFVINSWHQLLVDYPYDVMVKALDDFCKADVKGFAPAPGQLIHMISSEIHSNDMTEQEMLRLVDKAVSNSSYHAEEEYEKLSEVVKRAVGSVGSLRQMASMDYDSYEVLKHNIARSYRQALAQQKEREKINPVGLVQKARGLISG